jgi:sulfonate transport system substrate-binding protein
MKRRKFLGLSVGGVIAALSSRAEAQTTVKEIRIGYQKTGVLVIARQQAVLEKRFAGRQIGIKWIEFTSGPPLLEAMSIGSVDLGAVGDTPPIFAQAANANIVYVAGSRITNGQGILVPANSGIRSIADLKGKRVGFTKGSSAHNVVIATLEKAGLTYEDITPVYLTPPDAGPHSPMAASRRGQSGIRISRSERSARTGGSSSTPTKSPRPIRSIWPTAISPTPMCGKPAR